MMKLARERQSEVARDVAGFRTTEAPAPPALRDVAFSWIAALQTTAAFLRGYRVL
ncbi:MAG TPA: hypothetical protein VGP41_11030 [Candidatus Lustribacter sp.]|nr:hypothetical protein [Candidatus Lustribacter sp.]